MALIYITGPTGAGKTTVRNELIKRGYEAYDTDEGINRHYNIESGLAVEYPESKDVTSEWLSQHQFSMPKDKIEEMSYLAKEKLIFLCGAADNDTHLLHYFNAIICLSADKPTTKIRVKERTTNNYGKLSAEMDSILQNHDAIIQKYRDVGAIMIDTSLISLDEVVDKVLEVTKI